MALEEKLRVCRQDLRQGSLLASGEMRLEGELGRDWKAMLQDAAEGRLLFAEWEKGKESDLSLGVVELVLLTDFDCAGGSKTMRQKGRQGTTRPCLLCLGRCQRIAGRPLVDARN